MTKFVTIGNHNYKEQLDRIEGLQGFLKKYMYSVNEHNIEIERKVERVEKKLDEVSDLIFIIHDIKCLSKEELVKKYVKGKKR